MEIEQAKTIHSRVMKVIMYTRGIGEITSDDVSLVQEISLSDMALANSLMADHQEGTEATGFTRTMSTTDAVLADLYIRVNDEDFIIAEELEEACKAMNETFSDTPNGHAVLIDGVGNYSLVKLTDSGDCAEDTLSIFGSPRALYEYVKNKTNKSE